MAMLKMQYGRDEAVQLVQTAVGAETGTATLYVGDSHVLSTLSRDWVDAMQESGRFGSTNWSSKIEVPVTTFDSLVDQYGDPAFTKIDVEGFELEVLKGATRPPSTVSLEFAPEFLDRMLGCVRYLQSLGDYEFNYALGEPEHLELSDWIDLDAIAAQLSEYRDDHTVFGDVYARHLGN